MRPFIRLAAACALVSAAPALAQEGPAGPAGADHAGGPGTAPPLYDGRDRRPVWKEDREPAYAMDPASREAWLADCRYRVAQRGFAGGPDHCAVWLDANAMRYDGQGYGETVMVPVSKPGECVETVVSEPAPVIRRSIPRRAPVRRDKRIRL